MTTPPWEEMAQLVTELAVQQSDDEGHDAPPLLTELRRAVWGDIGRTMDRAGGNGLPLNVGAHLLWEELVDEIEAALSGVTGRRGTSSTHANLLAWWATFGMLMGQGWIDDNMQNVALDRLRGWHQRIRDQFDAPLQVPLRGFHCPNCGADRATWYDRDLEFEGPAIVVTLEGADLVATCRDRSCHHYDGERSRWVGDKEVLYMARRAGIDVEALAADIREARQPIEAQAVPEQGKAVIYPEDPTYAAHLAEMSGGGVA